MRYLAVLLALTATSAFGADIVFFRGSPEKKVGHVGEIPDSWRPRVVLVGDIVAGDDRHFSAVLKQAETQSEEWKSDRTRPAQPRSRRDTPSAHKRLPPVAGQGSAFYVISTHPGQPADSAAEAAIEFVSARSSSPPRSWNRVRVNRHLPCGGWLPRPGDCSASMKRLRILTASRSVTPAGG